MNTERLNEELNQHVEDAAHAAMLRGAKADEAVASAEAHLGDRTTIALAAERVITWHTVRELKLEFIFAVLLCGIAYSAAYSTTSPTYFISSPNLLLAAILSYGAQRLSLRPLRIHRPTYYLAAFLPIVAMTALGAFKDMFEAFTSPYSPYPTNTWIFAMRMTIIIAIASVTLMAQDIKKFDGANLHRLRFLPAWYFLATIVTLGVDSNRMNTLYDIPFYLPRLALDDMLMSIARLGGPFTPTHYYFEAAAIGLAGSVLLVSCWKALRVYRTEKRLPALETNIICYLVSFFAMLTLVY